MVTLADRILDVLTPGLTLDDDELAAKLGVNRQQVNQACNRMAKQGVVVREQGWRGKIVSRRMDAPVPPPRYAPAVAAGDLIREDDVKAALKEHLGSQGYEVTVMWGRERGIDLDARRPGSRIVIEAKGEANSQPQQTNYFIGALGELVQRMSDEDAGYGVAFPDNRVFQGLVARLPAFARSRLRLRVFLVARDGDSFSVREK
jgi:hypothetical protein